MIQKIKYNTAWKVFVLGVFQVRIQSECGKMQTSKTLNMDTIDAVQVLQLQPSPPLLLLLLLLPLRSLLSIPYNINTKCKNDIATPPLLLLLSFSYFIFTRKALMYCCSYDISRRCNPIFLVIMQNRYLEAVTRMYTVENWTKNFVKFTGKYLQWRALFGKAAYPVNFATFLRTAVLYKIISKWLPPYAHDKDDISVSEMLCRSLF